MFAFMSTVNVSGWRLQPKSANKNDAFVSMENSTVCMLLRLPVAHHDVQQTDISLPQYIRAGMWLWGPEKSSLSWRKTWFLSLLSQLHEIGSKGDRKQPGTFLFTVGLLMILATFTSKTKIALPSTSKGLELPSHNSMALSTSRELRQIWVRDTVPE